jgi:hypothetical protein
MKILGVITSAGVVGLAWFVGWRITSGVESWFTTSGAGNVLMWSVVAALILAVAAVPAAAWGMASRTWVVRVRQGEYLASSAHILVPGVDQVRPELLEQPGHQVRPELPVGHQVRPELPAGHQVRPELPAGHQV